MLIALVLHTMEELKRTISNKLKHPAIKMAWFAEQLYGSSEGKNRTKITLKVQEKKGWKEWELRRLEEVFAALKEEL